MIINVIRVFVGKRSMIWVLEALDGFTYIVKGVEKSGIKQAVSEKKKWKHKQKNKNMTNE